MAPILAVLADGLHSWCRRHGEATLVNRSYMSVPVSHRTSLSPQQYLPCPDAHRPFSILEPFSHQFSCGHSDQIPFNRLFIPGDYDLSTDYVVVHSLSGHFIRPDSSVPKKLYAPRASSNSHPISYEIYRLRISCEPDNFDLLHRQPVFTKHFNRFSHLH